MILPPNTEELLKATETFVNIQPSLENLNM